MVLKINPLAMHSILERIAAEEEEENDGHYQEEEEGGAHSLKDVCDLRRPAPSPFSSRRVMFENEQVKAKCEKIFWNNIIPSQIAVVDFFFIEIASICVSPGWP
jgi:hypothetical protein